MRKKLYILSDYGLDDAVATVYLLDNRDKFGDIDILAIGGNTSVQNSYNNIIKLLAAYKAEKSGAALAGVRIVDTALAKQFATDLPSIHGVDGMGDVLEEAKPVVPVVAYENWIKGVKADFIAAKQENAQVIVFSLGPCTLTNSIMDIAVESGAVDNAQLVIMAGVNKEIPNYMGYEFNQAMDIAGFNRATTFKHVIATLDTCREQAFNLAHKRIRGNGIFARLVNASEILAEARHNDNCYIYDFIAAHYLTMPQLFTINNVIDKWGNSLSELKVKEQEFVEATNAKSTGFNY